MRNNIEKRLSTKLRREILNKWPNAFVYKIPDTAGLGGLRPFDIIAIINKTTFCIETKIANKRATEYQSYWLDRAQSNGAQSMTINEENYINSIKLMEDMINGW